MLRLLLRWLVYAQSIWVTSLIDDGIVLAGSIWQIHLVALVIGLINSILKPRLQFFAVSLIVISVEFFTLLINTFLLWLNSLLTDTLVVLSSFLGCSHHQHHQLATEFSIG